VAKEDKSIPTGRIRRTARLAQTIGASGAGYAGARARSVGRGEEARTEQLDRAHMEAAERMVDALGTMKGAAMKIGQLASFIDTEFLPPEYRDLYQDKLATLRSTAPPMPWKKVRGVPDVVTRLSTERVLVSEWVDGAGFDEVRELPQPERDRFGEIVFRFCFGSIYHLQHFNADAHPGNYILMDDGRVAFLDFGMTKRLDPEQIELEQRAVDAASRQDPNALREALHDLGFIKNPSKLDAERLLDHVITVGGWYMEDREIEITPDRVMKVIESTSDPRSEYYSLMRRESLPADELMGRRMETGVLAVLAQLRARRNWHRIMREWVYADEPATELGEAEWAYFESRGQRRVPGYSGRPAEPPP